MKEAETPEFIAFWSVGLLSGARCGWCDYGDGNQRWFVVSAGSDV